MSLNAHILAYVVADLQDVRQRLIKEIEQCRGWSDGDDHDTVMLTIRDLEKLVARLTQCVVGLCHIVDPDKHTAVVREERCCEQEELPRRADISAIT
jgi:hypothetical protein